MRRVNAAPIDQSQHSGIMMNINVYKVHGRTLGGAVVQELLACINLNTALALERQLRQEEEEEEEEEEKREAEEIEHGPLFGIDDNDLQNQLLRLCMHYISTEKFAKKCYKMVKYMKL